MVQFQYTKVLGKFSFYALTLNSMRSKKGEKK